MPVYQITSTGPDHCKEFTATVLVGGQPLGSGVGKTKKEAEQLAASTAWKAISGKETMPELPEVEVVRRGLTDHVVGHRITSVEVLHPRAVRRHLGGALDLIGMLAGATITAANRRGKYLWLEADPAGRADHWPWWSTWV